MKEINTKIAGTSFTQEAVKQVKPNDTLLLVPEPDNKYDPNAVRITTLEGVKLGYIGKNKDVNKRIKEELKQGNKVTCTVLETTGTQEQTKGINIKLEIEENENA